VVVLYVGVDLLENVVVYVDIGLFFEVGDG